MFKQLKLLIGNGDKPLSDSSLQTYTQRLKWVKDKLKIKNDDIKNIVIDGKKVIDLIENSNLKVSTKKLTYIILSSIAKKLKLKDEEEYTKRATHYKDLDNFKRRDNKVTNRKDAWATWKQLYDVFDMIDEKKSMADCQDKLIVGLYTRCDYTLRLDWANVRYEKKKSNVRKYNHIVHDKDGYIFYLINYKTADKFGKQIIKLDDPELVQVLNYWFTEYNYDPKFLLVSYKNRDKGMSENALSKRIPIIFMKYIEKPVTNQILREIKESQNVYGDKKEYDEMDLNQKYELHKKLLHSFATGSEYAKKI